MFEIFIWWLLVEVIGLSVTPITLYFCNKLKDGGYSATKFIGILFLTYFSYLLTVLNLFNFGTFVIVVSLFLLVFVSTLLLISKNTSKKIFGIIKDKDFKKNFVLIELVFTVSFLFFALVRMYSPDITGGESRYDLAYTNTLTRIENFPPPHTWFQGVSLDNYYYFGHLTIAVLSLFSRVPTSMTYNLGMALYFGIICVLSYGVVYNLTKKAFYGLIAVILIAFVGNVFGLIQVINYFYPNIDFYVRYYEPPTGSLIGKFMNYNWWWPSRIIPWAIHEFTYWSFIWGDLHGHLMAIPIRILFVFLLLNIYKSEKTGFKAFGDSLPAILIGLFSLSMTIGFIFPMNIYDYPFLLFFVFLLFVFHDLKFAKKNKLKVLSQSFTVIGLTALLTFLLYFSIDSQLLQHWNSPIVKVLPHLEYYLLNTRAAVSPHLENIKTSLYHSMLVFSLQMFLIFSLLIYNFYEVIKKRKLLKRVGIIALILYFIVFLLIFSNFFKRPDEFYSEIHVKLTLNSLLFDFQLLIFLIPFILGSVLLLMRTKRDVDYQFALLMVIFGSFVVLITEIANIESRYVFMNKIYGEAYIFWGIASAYIIYFLSDKLHGVIKIIWLSITLVLFLTYLIFPILSTIQKTNDFRPSRGNLTLDGYDYLRTSHYDDYQAINWINENIKGTPVILEVPGRPYQHTSRVSVYTGLPTVLGWTDHMELHLAVDRKYINERSQEVDQIYDTTDNDKAIDLLKKYSVEYIYVGELEHNYENVYIGSEIEHKEYSKEGLDKFSNYPEFYTLIYNNSNVQIYHVNQVIK